MRTKIAALILFACLVSPVQARGPYGSISVAGWSGGAYTDDKTGQFSNCIASASYKSGINFGVLVNKSYGWALAFTHPSWSLAPGQKFPIVLSFDGRNTFNVDGIGTGSTVIVLMPDDSALIKSFRAARAMSAFAQGKLFQFNLNGTSVLIPALVTCVKAINAGGIAAATNFTAGLPANSTPRLVGPTAPPTTASSLEPTRPQEGSAELQLEAMQLAIKLHSQSRIVVSSGFG
jgi:hypothetical protein